MNLADNVNAANLAIDAKASTAINLVAGNNVQLGKYDGSDLGADTISIGNGFTTTQEWKTSGGNDVITVGDNATFAKLGNAGGDDTITFGANATVVEVDTGAGTDVVNTQTAGLNPKNAESTNVVCYAPGTMIDKPDGPRAVETLRVDDLVMTLDHGPVPIRWVRSGDQTLETADQDAKPVLIAAGALGRRVPAQDLIVSPQHRILVGGHGQLQGRFKTEAFAPAKSLTSPRSIRHMKGKQHITWVHIACDRHEVVAANGCLSDSPLLGPMVVNGLTDPERQAVTDIFGFAPVSGAALNGPPARECRSVGAVRCQLANSLEDKCRLVAKEIRKWDVDLAMERHEAELMRDATAGNQVRMKSVA